MNTGIPLITEPPGCKHSALQDMLMETSRPDVLSFALGLPAAELFPAAAFAKAYAKAVSADPKALQYGPPFQPLKSHIVKLMALRGVECSIQQVVLTAGAQQGINLLTRLLLGDNMRVMMEELVYPGFQQVVELYRPEILTVPSSFETGMEVDAVEDLLDRGARPAFIYTITEGHNPLSVSLHREKRARLIEAATRHDVRIIEDDPYGLLYYQDQPAPPLRALHDRSVFYVGSFSKILAPALRVGWIIAPENMVASLENLKEASDINTAALNQRVISAYLDAGDLLSHLSMLRKEYRARRDAMLSALDAYFPHGSKWHTPNSGVFIWVELPTGFNAMEALKTALYKERVAFIPGQAFCVNNDCQASNCMRLNFSNSAVDAIKTGIARLAGVLNSHSRTRR